MKQMTCEMCGSNNIVKQDGLYVCQYCGTKYSVEEAKKIMLEGKVKIDQSEELKNLYELARRAKNNDNTENAQRYYEQILIKDPSSWEANFYSVYFQSMNCKIGEIGIAAARITNSEETVFQLIKNNIKDEASKRKAVDEVAANLISLSTMLFCSYKNYYDNIGEQIRGEFTQQYADNCSNCRDIVYNCGNSIIKIFGDKYGDIAATCWQLGVSQHNILNSVYENKSLNASIIDSYNNKIKKYDSSYQPPRTNMGSIDGCYIATSVYGSYDCPQVWTLRRYRDYKLYQNVFGRAFIRIYYSISPLLVRIFGNNKAFKIFWKNILDRKIIKLQLKGYDSTPYNDKKR